MGELKGKFISCISEVKCGVQYRFFGLYFVDEAYDGKGYGLGLTKHAMSRSPCNNHGLNGVLDMVPWFEKIGFKTARTNRRMLLTYRE